MADCNDDLLVICPDPSGLGGGLLRRGGRVHQVVPAAGRRRAADQPGRGGGQGALPAQEREGQVGGAKR